MDIFKKSTPKYVGYVFEQLKHPPAYLPGFEYIFTAHIL